MPQLEIHRKLLNLTNLTLGSLIFCNPTLAQSASFVTDITKNTYLLSPIIVTEITDSPIHYRKPSQITIKKIEIIGNTVFSTEELRKLVASYEGQKLSFEQMLEISQIITEYYTSRGYIRSGAFVPPQELVNGIVKVQVIEGKLEEILIQGLKQTKESYVRARLEPRLTTPIQRKNLESALELLQIDPLFEKVEAELKPGSSPDKSVLVVKISEALPGTITLAADNYSSPSVGENQGTAALSYQNLLGIGDRFKFEYNGGAGLSRYKAGYSIPVNRNDGVLSIDYAHSDTEIVEDPFTVLDIQANSNVFSLNFRQPVLKTAKEELALSLGVELKESQTYLFKEIPFSFAEGAENRQ
jgi:hemolysin activation/secretion protein